ncbi:hypothetical protein HCJ76_33225 [Streptomyces sp. MC1]|uniref:hypothetical protein n=1 Tax=Streptomyces sp. MC1 TaxID=295105 RepID=UPI0018CAF340|nr:hypothetical protein [Streptomyces sp. MC1]MBG7702792.1 hypothetical protein [Streptomyces sp. MC1]
MAPIAVVLDHTTAAALHDPSSVAAVLATTATLPGTTGRTGKGAPEPDVPSPESDTMAFDEGPIS